MTGGGSPIGAGNAAGAEALVTVRVNEAVQAVLPTPVADGAC